MFKNIFSKLTKGKSGSGAKQLLSEEEAAEILDPYVAEVIARKVLEKPAYADLSAQNPQTWIERARFAIKTLRMDYYVGTLDYAIYALDQFIVHSPDKKSQLVAQADNVIKELVADWRKWKPLQKASHLSINMEVLEYLEIRRCTWLFQLEGYQEVVDFIDEHMSSLMLRTEESAQNHALASLLKAKSLVALGKQGEATKFCRKIYKEPPYNVFCCLKIGNMLLSELGCFEDAIECYDTITDKVRKTDSNVNSIANAWHNKALAYFQLRQLDKGKAALSQCIKIAPLGSETYTDAQYILDVINGRTKPASHGSNISFKILG